LKGLAPKGFTRLDVSIEQHWSTLLTNDGELTAQLTHPSFKKKKGTRLASTVILAPMIFKSLPRELKLMARWLRLTPLTMLRGSDGSELGVEIHSGQNRVVRRMFDALGYGVVKLDRVYFAGLTKKNLPRGKWRFLTPKEVNMLKWEGFNLPPLCSKK
jgi:23S rRNA pseudouridine2605 synthase